MVLAEHTGLEVSEGTYELIGKARELASRLGGVTEVALLGPRELADQLEGADIVVVGRAPGAGGVPARGLRADALGGAGAAIPAAVADVERDYRPRPRRSPLGALGRAACRPTSSALEIEDGGVMATAQILGGKVLAEIELPGERGDRHRAGRCLQPPGDPGC